MLQRNNYTGFRNPIRIFLRPAPLKKTSALAVSPVPDIATTIPSPNLSWVTFFAVFDTVDLYHLFAGLEDADPGWLADFGLL